MRGKRNRETRSTPASGAGPAVRRSRSVLRLAGRIALWALVMLLLFRGTADVLADPVDHSARSTRAEPEGVFDQGAEAFAADFARSYLEWDPAHPDFHATGLERFLSSELRESAALELPERGPTQTVREVTVAGVEQLDRERALVTVACVVAGRTVRTLFLTVPVGHEGGGFVVYDYPSLSAPPAVADVEPPEVSELEAREQAEIEDLVARFFAAYLAGRSDDLAVFTPPDIRLRALDQRLALLELVSLGQVGPEQGPRRTVLATLSARDPATSAIHTLRYRVGLELRDRWTVASVNTTTSEGR